MWLQQARKYNGVLPYIVNKRAIVFILSFMAMSAVALSLWQGYGFFYGKQEEAKLQQQAIDQRLSLLQERVAGIMSTKASLLHLLASSEALRQFITQEKGADAHLQKLFFAVLEARPRIYQVRYLDKSGMEKLRVDQIDGHIQVTPVLELQDKSSRDYFLEVAGMPSGEIYVSDINLNIEHDQVQVPWVPTMRIATSVYDETDNFSGAIVMNIDAEEIIDIYGKDNFLKDSSLFLVSPEGYWIAGKQSDLLWRFMFSDTNQQGKVDAVVWQKIVNNSRVPIVSETGEWSYIATHIRDIFPASLKYQQPQKVLWYAVVDTPSKGLNLPASSIIPSLAIFLVLLAFSWALTRSFFQQKQAEEELIKSEKLSSLGSLVAGVAHELNTPIGSAVTITSTMQDHATALYKEIESGEIKKSHIVQFVEDVLEATKISLRGLYRANELIGHFKQIAVDQTGELKRKFALDPYLQEMTATFEHLFRRGSVKLELELNSDAVLHTFPGSLSQVVINLVQNSLNHGFKEGDAGLVKVISRAAQHGYAEIIVEDTGVGISQHLIDRVVEPFFTTKLGQGGSGLGLHIVYSIVHDILNGHLDIESDTEKRITRFTVTIPCLTSATSELMNKGEQYEAQPAA